MSKENTLLDEAKETMELPTIDWNLCVTLANNKEDIAEELLILIIQQLPADLEAIQLAFEEANYPELLRYVHKLHGALCYSGLPRLKQVLSSFESTLKKKTFDSKNLSDMMHKLEAETKRVLSSKLPA